MSNKYEATFYPSDGPTRGAREALVEHLAEAWVDRQGDVWRFLPGATVVERDGQIIGTDVGDRASREYVEQKWGPLAPAPVSSGQACERQASCGARVCSTDYTHGPHRHENGVTILEGPWASVVTPSAEETADES